MSRLFQYVGLAFKQTKPEHLACGLYFPQLLALGSTVNSLNNGHILLSIIQGMSLLENLCCSTCQYTFFTIAIMF